LSPNFREEKGRRSLAEGGRQQETGRKQKNQGTLFKKRRGKVKRPGDEQGIRERQGESRLTRQGFVGKKRKKKEVQQVIVTAGTGKRGTRGGGLEGNSGGKGNRQQPWDSVKGKEKKRRAWGTRSPLEGYPANKCLEGGKKTKRKTAWQSPKGRTVWGILKTILLVKARRGKGERKPPHICLGGGQDDQRGDKGTQEAPI